MAKKDVVEYVCSSCGATTNTWSGKCYSCGEWNTLEEQITTSQVGNIVRKGAPLKPSAVGRAVNSSELRLLTGIKEYDSVMGGGIVTGSVNLIAGQPGIGKSTLLLQVAYTLASKVSVLYVSGEESVHQIGLRAQRLGIEHANLEIVVSNSADDISATIASSKYKLVVVDSIQTLICSSISSAAGSVSQITNSAQLLIAAAKQTNTALLIVGHVTKEGSIAGPKILEHIVDVVLNLEGERYGGFKMLRAVKNRYGSTNEVGIFEMTDKGLEAVDNPSAALLAERQVADGSIVMASIEGTRPILVEIQALVNRSSFGYPKRTASGFDINRLTLLVAMLEKRTKLNLQDQDIYINVVGGIRLNEPAADLAVCMAIASASKGMQLKKNVVVFGEVGLSGEVRHVPFIDKRLAEAKKLGFDGAVGPKNSTAKRQSSYTEIRDIRSALNTLLEKD